MTHTSALPNGQLVIIVRPSTRDKAHPLTAYIGGTQTEGCGPTVFAAIEDLFTDAKTAKACAKLERQGG